MSVGWPDIGGALLWVAGGLLVLAGVIALLTWDARRRQSTAAVVDVTAAVARMWLLLVALGSVFVVLRWFTADFTEVSGLPVSMPWPTTLPCDNAGAATASTPTLNCASISSIDATITGLSAGARILLALGDALGLTLAALPAVVILVICRQTLKGTPFHRVTSRWLFIAAVVVLVAGIGGGLATEIGRGMAAVEVLPPPGDSAVTTTGVYRVDAPLWPIGAALALAALGAVFRHGAVLQRETEGLV